MSLIQIINLEPVSDEEMEERFDLTREQLAEREEIYAQGDIPDSPISVKKPGRPPKFADDVQLVGFKEPVTIVELMDKRAEDLGVSWKYYILTGDKSKLFSRQKNGGAKSAFVKNICFKSV